MRTDRQWEILAGEYVIGTLSATEQKVYANILRHDLDFQERVSRWQNTLAPLDLVLDANEPDARVWLQIAATLRFSSGATDPSIQVADAPIPGNGTLSTDSELNPETSDFSTKADKIRNQPSTDATAVQLRDDTLDHTDTGDLTGRFDDSDLSGDFHDDSGHFSLRKQPIQQRSRRVRRRGTSRFFWFFTGVLLASLIWSQQSTIKTLLSPYFSGSIPKAPLGLSPDLVSVINDREGRPAWVVSARIDYRRIQVIAVNPPARDGEQVHELWMVKEDQQDWVSAGVLTGVPGRPEELHAGGLRDDVTEFAVSIEPLGGSIEGRPTSELLFRGTAHSIRRQSR